MKSLKAKPVKPVGKGRPAVWDRKAVVDEVCARLAVSEMGLARLMGDDRTKFPTALTFLTWIDANEDFQRQYAKAMMLRAQYMEHRLNEIADEESLAPLYDLKGQPIRKANGDLVMGVSSVGVAHARLRIDTRKWLMSKMMPKKYGDKLALGNDPDSPLTPTKPQDLSKLTNEELQTLIALQSKLNSGE